MNQTKYDMVFMRYLSDTTSILWYSPDKIVMFNSSVDQGFAWCCYWPFKLQG